MFYEIILGNLFTAFLIGSTFFVYRAYAWYLSYQRIQNAKVIFEYLIKIFNSLGITAGLVGINELFSSIDNSKISTVDVLTRGNIDRKKFLKSIQLIIADVQNATISVLKKEMEMKKEVKKEIKAEMKETMKETMKEMKAEMKKEEIKEEIN